MICSCSQQTNQTKLDHLSILKISLRPPWSEIAIENTMQIKKGSTHSWPRVTKPRIIHAHLNDPNVLWQLTVCIGPLDKGEKVSNLVQDKISRSLWLRYHRIWFSCSKTITNLSSTSTDCDWLKFWDGGGHLHENILGMHSIVSPVITALLQLQLILWMKTYNKLFWKPQSTTNSFLQSNNKHLTNSKKEKTSKMDEPSL